MHWHVVDRLRTVRRRHEIREILDCLDGDVEPLQSLLVPHQYVDIIGQRFTNLGQRLLELRQLAGDPPVERAGLYHGRGVRSRVHRQRRAAAHCRLDLVNP